MNIHLDPNYLVHNLGEWSGNVFSFQQASLKVHHTLGQIGNVSRSIFDLSLDVMEACYYC